MIHKILAVARQVFLQKITKLSYFWMILLPILLIIVGVCFQQYSQKQTSQSTPTIAVISNNSISSALAKQKPTNYRLSDIHSNDTAKVLMKDQSIDAILKISDDIESASISSNKELSSSVTDELQTDLTQLKVTYKASQLNLSNSDLKDLLSPVKIKNTGKQSTTLEEKEKKESTQNVSQFVTIVLFFFLTSYITITGTEIGKEKGHHILQSVLSAIPARAYFTGKLLGIIYLIAFQFGIYLMLYGFAVAILPLFHQGQLLDWSSIQGITPLYITAVIVLSLLTMLIYIMLSAILASFVSRIEDVSQATSGVTTVLILPYFFSFFAQTQPNNIITIILSYFPFTSYAIMPSRIANGVVGFSSVFISIVLAAITAFLVYRLAAVTYERNAFSYSKKRLIQSVITSSKNKLFNNKQEKK